MNPNVYPAGYVKRNVSATVSSRLKTKSVVLKTKTVLCAINAKRFVPRGLLPIENEGKQGDRYDDYYISGPVPLFYYITSFK